jgi:hypothetical protein
VSKPNQAVPCTPETALALYRHLEYYREYMPVLVGKTEAAYAATKEAMKVDVALAAYRVETGTSATFKDGRVG